MKNTITTLWPHSLNPCLDAWHHQELFILGEERSLLQFHQYCLVDKNKYNHASDTLETFFLRFVSDDGWRPNAFSSYPSEVTQTTLGVGHAWLMVLANMYVHLWENAPPPISLSKHPLKSSWIYWNCHKARTHCSNHIPSNEQSVLYIVENQRLFAPAFNWWGIQGTNDDQFLYSFIWWILFNVFNFTVTVVYILCVVFFLLKCHIVF